MGDLFQTLTKIKVDWEELPLHSFFDLLQMIKFIAVRSLSHSLASLSVDDLILIIYVVSGLILNPSLLASLKRDI